MKPLIDFSNIDNFTYSRMGSYLRQHNIFFTQAGELAGNEMVLLTKNSSSPFYLRAPSDPEKIAEGFIVPSTENELLMSDHLKKSQAEYRAFLNAATKGYLDVEFVNSRLSRFKTSNLIVSETDDPFKLSFELNLFPLNLEMHLDIYEIIYPLWRGEGTEFSRLKKCGHCSNFFHARSLKAVFCSVKCKNAHGYQGNKFHPKGI